MAGAAAVLTAGVTAVVTTLLTTLLTTLHPRVGASGHRASRVITTAQTALSLDVSETCSDRSVGWQAKFALCARLSVTDTRRTKAPPSRVPAPGWTGRFMQVTYPRREPVKPRGDSSRSPPGRRS